MCDDRQSKKTFRLVRWPIAGFSLAILLVWTLASRAEDNSRGVQPTPPSASPRNEDVAGSDLARLVEEDWVLQARSQPVPSAADAAVRATLHQTDAAGACDGLKDGKYGFHTGLEANPWWQVDLGQPTALTRIVVYNRLDYLPGLHNADNLQILTSDDAKDWTLRYDNRGRHFGGIQGVKPLEVKLDPGKVHARFVRLRVPSPRPIYFHLDEVGIYGPGSNEKNLALWRPACQSSISQWSTPKSPMSQGYPTADFIQRGRRLAADLRRAGVDVQPHLRRLDEAAQRLAALPADASEQVKRSLYLDVRWAVRRLAFSNPLLAFDKLLFVKRFTQETYPDVCLNHMPWVSRPGGDMCVLSAAPGSAGLFAALGDCCDSGAGPSMAAGRPLAGWPGHSSAKKRTIGQSLAGRSVRVAEPQEVCRTDTSGRCATPTRFPATSNVSSRASGGKVSGPPEQVASPAAPSPPTGRPVAKLRYLLNRALGPGHVHGVDLWWDGDRVVFGYAKAKSDQPPDGWLDRSQSYRLRRTEEPIHLFEMSLDGRRLRQLTQGEWSDLDPAYLPNGDVAFVSERCGTSLQCNEFDKDETSCNLYVMRPDGSGIRRMSVNKDGDYLPHCLDNGLLAYTRWEYHERSWAFIQSIWVIRPDGTGADALFKQHFVNPWALEETRSIPGSGKLVAIAAGHHTLPVGPVVIVNHALGINDPKGIHIVTPGVLPPEGGMDGVPVAEGDVAERGGFYGGPWPLSEKYILACYTYGDKTTNPVGYGLYLIDVFGNKELIYRDPTISCFTPIPLRPRPRPPILPDTTDPKLAYAECVVNDVAYGVDGIAPERIRYLRIAEPIGWPYDNQLGGQRYGEDHRYGGPGAERKNLTNWTPIRILGDVPIQRDGSVRFRVPADTAVYFQLLDENRMELRRMRSFISFQRGESRGCVGCHESRAVTPTPRPLGIAASLEPPAPLAVPWGDRPIAFLRDVQPVLDRHCVSCHGGLKPDAGLDFAGGLISYDDVVAGYGHNRAFETILAKGLVSLSAARAQDASITPPLAYGSHKSKLFTALTKEPHAAKVKLNAEEQLRLTAWIDANAPYHDRFVNKRPESPAYDLAADRQLLAGLTAVHARRCSGCHAPAEVTRPDWIDLGDARRTLFLAAPLSKHSGGTGKCRQTVYQTPQDADYQDVLGQVQSALSRQWGHPRRDVQSLEDSPPARAVAGS